MTPTSTKACSLKSSNANANSGKVARAPTQQNNKLLVGALIFARVKPKRLANARRKSVSSARED
jgi:hypothetical protein